MEGNFCQVLPEKKQEKQLGTVGLEEAIVYPKTTQIKFQFFRFSAGMGMIAQMFKGDDQNRSENMGKVLAGIAVGVLSIKN